MIDRIVLDYDKFYKLEPNQIYNSITGYTSIITAGVGILLFLAGLVLIFKAFFLIRKKRGILLFRDLKIDLFFLSWFLLFMLIQLPWIFVMGRYLSPAMLGLAGFLGIEIADLVNFLVKKIRIRDKIQFIYWGLVLIVVLGFFYLIVFNGKGYLSMYLQAISWNKNNSEMVSFLATKAPKNVNVFINTDENGIEFVYEIGLHMKFFYNRPDLKVQFLEFNDNTNFNKDDIILSQSSISIFDLSDFANSLPGYLVKQKTFLSQYDDSSWDYYTFVKNLKYTKAIYQPKQVASHLNQIYTGKDVLNGTPIPVLNPFNKGFDGTLIFKIQQIPSSASQKILILSQFQENPKLPELTRIYIDNRRLVFNQYETNQNYTIYSDLLDWNNGPFVFEIRFGKNGLKIIRNGVFVINDSKETYLNFIEPIFFYNDLYEKNFIQTSSDNLIYAKYNEF